MEKSTSIKELATALNAFQKEMTAVNRDGNNPFFKSKYATLENVINSTKDLLTKHGLAFSQLPNGTDGLMTIIMHISGEYIASTVTMTPKDKTPQAQGSAITYMRRYALSSALGLATEVDDDGNEATGLVKEKSAPKDKAEPKNKELDKQRTTLLKLFKDLGIDPFVIEDKILLGEEVKKATNLDFEPKNYPEIISRLEIIIDENNAAANE